MADLRRVSEGEEGQYKRRITYDGMHHEVWSAFTIGELRLPCSIFDDKNVVSFALEIVSCIMHFSIPEILFLKMLMWSES